MLSFNVFIKQRKYFASAFLFACFSLIFSTWVTYIPHIADKIGITEGKIGGAIFFSAVGSFLMIPLANRFVDRIGVGRSTYLSLVVYAFTLFGPFLAYNYGSLCVALFIFGMASSWYAISLNSLTATIEKQDKVYIMIGSHGFWSIGGMVGAASGSFIAALLHNSLIHVSLIVVFIVGIQTYLRSEYYFRRGEHPSKEKHGKKHIKSLFIIAIIGLILMVAEGAIADWGALYLKKIVHIPIQYIGMGYAVFSFAMMIGRFSGDSLSKKHGSWQLLTYATLLSIMGFLLVLILQPIISLFGFFIVGLGFSVIVPEVYRLASNVEGIHTSDGVSFIAASTNIGFLAGPVLLGFLAEFKSLHLSFIVLTAFVSLAFFISLWKNRREKKGTSG
jgi:predicted MFS family arabinose efflux permease